MENKEGYLTPRDFAVRAKVSTPKVYALIREKKLTSKIVMRGARAINMIPESELKRLGYEK